MTYQWDNKKPTAQMLGRWQPFHDGHYKLFEEIIKKIQDGENPAEVLTAELVKDVALVGSISSCKDTLNRFIDAGADMPIITPNAVGKQSPLEVMQNIIDVIS